MLGGQQSAECNNASVDSVVRPADIQLPESETEEAEVEKPELKAISSPPAADDVCNNAVVFEPDKEKLSYQDWQIRTGYSS